MSAIPKPTPHKVSKKLRKSGLGAFRRQQAALAIDRDEGLCVFCFFMEGKRVRADDVHHVYGRGKTAGDPRENYRCLVNTCRRHHPQPIKAPGSETSWQLPYVDLANRTPINRFFVHPSGGAD